jgi:hypothetical protein
MILIIPTAPIDSIIAASPEGLPREWWAPIWDAEGKEIK